MTKKQLLERYYKVNNNFTNDNELLLDFLHSCILFNYNDLFHEFFKDEIVTYKGINNNTLLTSIADYDNSLNEIKLLIEKGADVNNVTAYEQTPLSNAISINNLDNIKCLVENGADVNYCDKFFETPLSKAIIFCNVNVVKYLIEHGANTTYKNIDGKTLLDIAIEFNRTNTTEYLKSIQK